MRIIINSHQIDKKFKRPVVTLGIFDGVHKGHKRILKKVVKKARQIDGTSIVITFDPHPSRILGDIGAPPLLVSVKHRLNLISKEGIDVAYVLNFNRRFARLDAKEFVKKVLAKKIGAHSIIIGADFKFGRDKKGDIKLLKSMARAFKFSVEGVPLLKIGSEPVSSTRIREFIMAGRLKKAAAFLGRPVSILGTVVKGRKRGRLLGYPTANINPHHEAIPPSGVYAVYVMYEGKRYKGLLNIGMRPTFNKVHSPRSIVHSHRDSEPTIEVHIFDFEKNIYGKDIEILFIKKLRDEIKFPDKKELIKQIRIDECKAGMIL